MLHSSPTAALMTALFGCRATSTDFYDFGSYGPQTQGSQDSADELLPEGFTLMRCCTGKPVMQVRRAFSGRRLT
jgi:hypothetical protein